MDIIRGEVVNVIDGDTFDVKVTHFHQDNDNDYKSKERVRIDGVDAPELPTRAGKRAKRDLSDALLGEEVELHIYSRDTYGRLIADVEVEQS